MDNIRKQTRKVAILGMMLAVICVLSMLEHTLPPIPGLPPGVRFGLSNVVTMYALFFMGRWSAFMLVVLKSIFVLLIRGLTAGLLSFSGGLLSILMIVILILLFKNKVTYLILSIAGAVMHNIGQIAMASLLLGSGYVFYYLPVLIISGIIMGSTTGTLLKIVMPYLHQILHKEVPKNK